jgi:DNA-binding winged helix-turn-helix (wHTH) protein/Tfp pilus assembly protein PilF
MHAPRHPGRFHFGRFEFDPTTGELASNGQSSSLQPQPARLLQILISRAGELVTREELRQHLWPDGTIVDFDQALNYSIRQIRTALGESAGEPLYIETLPKRGYRFIATVTVPSAQTQHPKPWLYLYSLAAALVLLIAGFYLYSSSRKPGPLGKPQALDLDTYNLYLKAVSMKDQLSRNGAEQSAKAFEEVIRRAPTYAPAHAGLANTLATFPFVRKAPPKQTLNKAAEIARRAIALDPSLAEAHSALAHAYFNLWKWREAEAEFRTALKLNPNSATTLQLFAVCLATRGRFDEALLSAEAAAKLAPTSGLIAFTITTVHFHAGHYDQAIEAGRRTIDIDRGFSAVHTIMSRAYAMKGMFSEALASHAEWAKFGSERSGHYWAAHIKAVSGNKAEAIRMLRQAEKSIQNDAPQPLPYAITLFDCGEIDRGFDALHKSLQAHLTSIIWLKATPELHKWQNDPRYLSALALLDQETLNASASPTSPRD